MLVAKAAGATVTAITDISENRLAFAKGKGADMTAKVPEGLAGLDSTSWDVAIDCTGVAASTATLIGAVRKGGTVVLVGMGSQNIDIQPILVKELDMVGVFRYCNTYPIGPPAPSPAPRPPLLLAAACC